MKLKCVAHDLRRAIISPKRGARDSIYFRIPRVIHTHKPIIVEVILPEAGATGAAGRKPHTFSHAEFGVDVQSKLKTDPEMPRPVRASWEDGRCHSGADRKRGPAL